NYKFGRKHGLYKEWFENQRLKLEGNFAGNKKVDDWVHYSNTGEKVKTEKYKNNKLVNTY
ncbi:MAG: hypothetical protein KAR17_06795, partial [Cyclobacteriaceae bacterium]|nr:hypothetical protein [Cyclobacteriaceae bacterium]